MSDLQKAIEEITYWNYNVFPKAAFQVITANKEEAIPYLREAVEHALSKRTDLETNYQLHFYALYLLGEFQDRESFSKIMELVSLPGDDVEYLIGDCITTGLPDILYNTYDGNIELLKESIQNSKINEFVRAGMLDVMGQLYFDGSLAEADWRDFLRQNVHDGRDYDYLYNAIGHVLCRCHFFDMLPEIRYMFERDVIDEIVMGNYDSYVDAMFRYREDEKSFCKAPMNAAEMLKTWAMFSKEPDNAKTDNSELDLDKLLRIKMREENIQSKKIKIGRNDPCPCGSGKKYKFCCLKKPKDAMDQIESPEERNKWLGSYPYTGQERIQGRIYLEDYFDAASIEIDKILYLALMNRPGWTWNRNMEAEERREREYLYLAFQKCKARMDSEQIRSFAEYDEKYSIHYLCGEWIGELSRLLENSNDMQAREEVRKWADEYA